MPAASRLGRKTLRRSYPNKPISLPMIPTMGRTGGRRPPPMVEALASLGMLETVRSVVITGGVTAAKRPQRRRKARRASLSAASSTDGLWSNIEQHPQSGFATATVRLRRLVRQLHESSKPLRLKRPRGRHWRRSLEISPLDADLVTPDENLSQWRCGQWNQVRSQRKKSPFAQRRRGLSRPGLALDRYARPLLTTCRRRSDKPVASAERGYQPRYDPTRTTS